MIRLSKDRDYETTGLRELFIDSTYKFDLESSARAEETERQRNIFKTTWRLRVCSSSSSSSFSLPFLPSVRVDAGCPAACLKNFHVYRNNRTKRPGELLYGMGNIFGSQCAQWRYSKTRIPVEIRWNFSTSPYLDPTSTSVRQIFHRSRTLTSK